MIEELWFLLILWFICLVFGFKFKQRFFVGLSAILGLFMGLLTMIDVYVWLGLIFIFASFYLLYYTMFSMIKTKKE